jgi:esterase/lipase superfamily enzyme
MQSRHLLLPGGELGRDQHLWAHGWWGEPVVVFPSAAGMAHEWQAQGMVEALAPLVDAGRIKLYCAESNVSEAWTRKDRPVPWRLERHAAYERWVLGTLVPFVRRDCNQEHARIATAGCSLGGSYATLFALKFPEVFHRAIAMSGRYLMSVFTGAHQGADLYFLNPLAFVPNLAGEALERVRRTHLTLVCGRGRWEEGCIEETIALADWCGRKGIPHVADIWGEDSYHDWPCWRQQAAKHL